MYQALGKENAWETALSSPVLPLGLAQDLVVVVFGALWWGRPRLVSRELRLRYPGSMTLGKYFPFQA